MNLGDKFKLQGYDVMAHAVTDMGRVLVLTNNANFVLVATTFEPDGVVDDVNHEGTLEGSFEYGGDPGDDDGKPIWQEAYRDALHQMVSITLARV